ncbi:MAG: EamA family transporter, partial [Rhodobacteraceae bacterium]|nr:EamA family transporter [Paracoccaceae bacterium]
MNTLRGVFLVTFSMAAFSVEDALVKHLTESLAVGQVLFSVGLGGAAIYLVLALRAGHRNPLAVLADRAVLVRTLSEMVSTVTFVTALSLVPLSTVAAVFQATPLAVTAGAALFLGEVVGWRRWTAISVGFAGVLMIIRPGFAGFQPASMLVLVTVAAIALRDLVTRRVPAHIPSLLVAFHGFSALVAAGALLLALGQPARMPAPGDWLGLAAAI